jgi:hypothetical protein
MKCRGIVRGSHNHAGSVPKTRRAVKQKVGGHLNECLVTNKHFRAQRPHFTAGGAAARVRAGAPIPSSSRSVCFKKSPRGGGVCRSTNGLEADSDGIDLFESAPARAVAARGWAARRRGDDQGRSSASSLTCKARRWSAWSASSSSEARRGVQAASSAPKRTRKIWSTARSDASRTAR